jgi:alpha-mannosidase
MTHPSVEEILVLHHSHLDIGYTHGQPIVWELQSEYISQAIDWLEQTTDLPEDAQPKWTCEATEPVLRWLRSASAEDRSRFVALHEQGRIGLAALRWNTSALTDRAGLERLVAGKHELEDIMGSPIQVACQHDVPGVPWPLADVLLDAGVEFFVMGTNLHSARPVQPRPGMFLWEAPSGRRLRVFNGHHYTMFDQLLYAWDNSVERMAQGWSELEKHLGTIDYRLPFVYLSSTCSPVMWDNAPPNPYLPDLIQRWNAARLGPRIRYATLDDLRAAASVVADDDLPVQRGDWTDYWTFGCASTPRETALNRQAKVLMEDASTVAGPSVHATAVAAADQADLFDEHSWGFWDARPEHPQAQTAELLQQAAAHEANELASFALMDALERLADNPVADRGTDRVLICNPSPFTRQVAPSLPEWWFAGDQPSGERTYRARRMYYDNRPWRVRLPGDEGRSFGPVTLEPRSWQVLRIEELPPQPETSLLSHVIDETPREDTSFGWDFAGSSGSRIGRITSPFHTLEYDAETGRILSLVDRALQREVLNRKHRFDLFAFVRERPDALVDGSRDSFYRRNLATEKFDGSDWQAWEPIRETATRATSCNVHIEPDRVTLERRLEAPGTTYLVQRITLSAYQATIEMEAELELTPDPAPHGMYFAVPLAMDGGWSAVFDTAGHTVRLDDDQLPGANRSWVTAETMGAISSDDLTVVLLTPDAPMIQFGDFHFGPPLDTVPRTPNPLLLAWPVNNYWCTNYPLVQHGRIQLRYGLLTMNTLDVPRIRQHAYQLSQPPLVWPVTSGGRPAGSGDLPMANNEGENR